MKTILKKIINRLRGEISTEKYIACGMKVGRNFKRMQGCSFDISHCWLIEIGNDVTISSDVKFIAHDASTNNALNYTLIGAIKIGDNCFIGANSMILPNVTIGDKVIIGAGTVVTKSIPPNSVVAGNPARIICEYEEYITKRKKQMAEFPNYGEDYTTRRNIDFQKKEEMKEALENNIGFVR